MKNSYDSTRSALTARRSRPLLCARGICCAITFLLASAHAPTTSAQQLAHVPVEVHVPNPPASVQALGRQHLVYEVHLTNFGGDAATLKQVRVRSADQPAGELAASGTGELTRRFRVVGQAAHAGPSGAVLSPGARGILYQWIALAPQAQTPSALLHEFVFETGDEGRADTLRPAALPVAAGAPPTIAPPVGAGRWVAVRGPSNDSGHRRSLAVLGGEAHVPERFAVDWVRLGERGRLFDGDPKNNANWFSYDQPVLAAAAGRVVRVRDGVPENTPLSEEIAALPFTPETVTGNAVVVEMGPGRFAVYAHLRPGSISVAVGDRVEAGQEIGRIGNSGHSLAPHLHFHVEDGADPLMGEGLPFVLSSFELIGRLDALPQALQGQPWAPHPDRPARTVSREIPLENMVIEVR